MKISYVLAAVMVALTFLINITRHTVPPYLEGTPISVPLQASPIEKELYYDWPSVYEKIDYLNKRYGESVWEHLEEIPAAYQKELVSTPVWQGFLPQILGYHLPPAPWFEKISQGEVWRTFTPALIHTDLWHLVFNLFWLIALGRLVEERTGWAKYLLLTLLFGILSNTAQYLMTGLHFLGYSGVISGLFGYAYMDKKHGTLYPLAPSLFTVTFVFIFGVALLETISLFSPLKMSWGIANTAHITGLLSGLIAGQLLPSKEPA